MAFFLPTSISIAQKTEFVKHLFVILNKFYVTHKKILCISYSFPIVKTRFFCYTVSVERRYANGLIQKSRPRRVLPEGEPTAPVPIGASFVRLYTPMGIRRKRGVKRMLDIAYEEG